MAAAYAKGGAVTNLLMAPAFIAMMKEAHPSLRRVVARGALEAGFPMPALSSALAYFDSYRQGRGTANLTQAQRDFFGAHGFERIDAARRASRPVGQRRGRLISYQRLFLNHLKEQETWHGILPTIATTR